MNYSDMCEILSSMPAKLKKPVVLTIAIDGHPVCLGHYRNRNMAIKAAAEWPDYTFKIGKYIEGNLVDITVLPKTNLV